MSSMKTTTEVPPVAATSFAHDEILSQPATWDQTLASVPGQWREIAPRVPFAPDTQVFFIGCGTSFYLAQTAASTFQEITGYTSRAVPGSEMFLSPASILPRSAPAVAFVVSRSGTSSEAVMAARYLKSNVPGARTVGITCSPETELAGQTDFSIELFHANDQSVVMTRSFTNMLLALQVIATLVAGADGLRAELASLPGHLRLRLDAMQTFARELGTDGDLRRFVYLGLGPNYGLAAEATLKLKEMTQVECEPYNPLEFRHGAISLVREDTAVVLLEGEREREYIGDVEAHVKRYGARVAAIAPYQSAHAHNSVLLPDGLSDVTRSVLYLPPVQLLAYERAVMLGLDPDAPRNLGHVVVLHGR
jgi:glutamine---fructose-6-phosphate transaminase (isomerizing)